MHKFTSTLLFFFVFSIPLIAQDWTEDTCTLKGNVKFLTHSSVSNLFAAEENWQTLDLDYEYNEQGFLVRYNISASYFGENANTNYRIYDETGMRCLIEYQLQDGDTASRYEYSYNAKGKVEQALLYRWGDLIRTFNYVHDERGLLIEYYVDIPEAGYTSHHYYQYNASGRKIGESESHPSHKEIWFWKYDENGYLIEEQLIDSNWASSTTIKVKKNGKHGRRKTVDYSKNVNTTESYTIKFTNNEKGQVISKSRTDANGKPVSDYTYTYSDQGDEITKIHYNYEKERSNEWSFTYTYDEQGNWITKTVYFSGQLFEEVKRKIVYF